MPVLRDRCRAGMLGIRANHVKTSQIAETCDHVTRPKVEVSRSERKNSAAPKGETAWRVLKSASGRRPHGISIFQMWLNEVM